MPSSTRRQTWLCSFTTQIKSLPSLKFQRAHTQQKLLPLTKSVQWIFRPLLPLYQRRLPHHHIPATAATCLFLHPPLQGLEALLFSLVGKTLRPSNSWLMWASSPMSPLQGNLCWHPPTLWPPSCCHPQEAPSTLVPPGLVQGGYPAQSNLHFPSVVTNITITDI